MKSKKPSKKVTYILLAKDLDLIEKGELGTLKKYIAEIESRSETEIPATGKPSTLESSNPWTLFSNAMFVKDV